MILYLYGRNFLGRAVLQVNGASFLTLPGSFKKGQILNVQK